MATRRTVKDALAPEPHEITVENSDTTPAVPLDVIYKLLAFTIAMICAPLATYFGTVNLLFKGNSTYAGATAAVAANVVLVAYIVAAFREDQADRIAAEVEKKTKKTE
ncbi:hypothetical protein VTO42DRAFT_3453 [Malbranchea cinnamomea]